MLQDETVLQDKPVRQDEPVRKFFRRYSLQEVHPLRGTLLRRYVL